MANSIGDVADSILSQVVDRTKTASVETVTVPQGEAGQALMKVAALLRKEASLKIDYTDIANFRVIHGI